MNLLPICVSSFTVLCSTMDCAISNVYPSSELVGESIPEKVGTMQSPARQSSMRSQILLCLVVILVLFLPVHNALTHARLNRKTRALHEIVNAAGLMGKGPNDVKAFFRANGMDYGASRVSEYAEKSNLHISSETGPEGWTITLAGLERWSIVIVFQFDRFDRVKRYWVEEAARPKYIG